MERVRLQAKGGQLPRGDRLAGRVGMRVEQSLRAQTGLCPRLANQVHDRLVADERLPAPGEADEREQAVFDPVSVRRRSGPEGRIRQVRIAATTVYKSENNGNLPYDRRLNWPRQQPSRSGSGSSIA